MAANYEKRGFVMNPRFGLNKIQPRKTNKANEFSYYYVIGIFSFYKRW